MSAAPVDYPPAVLEEADLAMRAAISAAHRGGSYPEAVTLAGAQAYAAVLARYTVAARIAAEPGCYESLMRAFGANPDGTDVTATDPPVDEDARELARAYERGRADATRDAAKQLCALGLGFDAWRIEENERARLAAKQGAESHG